MSAGTGAPAAPPSWPGADDDTVGSKARAGAAARGAGDDVDGLEAYTGTRVEPEDPKKNTVAARPSASRMDELVKEAMDTLKEKRKVAEEK